MRVAVIGTGRMGSRHADNLAKGAVPGAQLGAICDTDPEVRANAERRWRVKAYADYRELVDSGDVQAVVVATPHYSHVEICKYAIEHGLHTLVEKPISVTVQDAEALVNTADRHGDVIFGIVYNQRTNPLYAYAKRLIAQGGLGRIVRADFTVTDWYRSQYYYDMNGWRASWSGEGGGTLINQCVHQLDLLQWILGVPKDVDCKCRTVGRNITTENDVTALFGYGDFDCSFRASTHELPGVNRLEIAGSKGLLTVTRGTLTAKLLKTDESEVNARSQRDYGNKADKKYRTIRKFYGLGNYLFDGLYGQQCRVLRAFVKAAEKRDPSLLVAGGEEGVAALSMINAMNYSDWTGRAVALPADGKAYAEALQFKIEKEREQSRK